jgi:dTDP-4-dehydrorhamnose reductase
LRPKQSTLSLQKIESTGFKINNWKNNIRVYIKSLQLQTNKTTK